MLVLDGRLPVGTVLPSERALAESLDTSRTTTTSAFRLLREEGFAVSSQGAGTWTTLPVGDGDPGSQVWPFSSDGERAPAGAHGDFSSAATEAPPELYTAYQAALCEMPHYLPGSGYVTSGLPTLRARIAELYTARGLPTVPDQVLVTSGSLQALHLVLDVVAQRGDRVLVEHPTYPPSADAIRARSGRPVPLPMEGGWDLARARTLIRQTGAQLAYLMIDFHNPTGALMSAPDRIELARVLAETGCTAVVDESLIDLDLRQELAGMSSSVAADSPVVKPPPMPLPLPAYLGTNQVISIGSASKTLWGGLRIGWIRATQPLIRQLAVARSAADMGSPVLEQIATGLLLADLEPLLTRRRRLLAERCTALRDALRVHLPDWTVPVPDGGMSLWVRLPEPRSTQLVSAARPLGVRLIAGPRFGLDGAFEGRLRLPFARASEDLVAMAEVLGAAWRSSGGIHLDDDHFATV